MIINPYLNFDGKTEEAFNFYKSIFGGEFSALQRFKDTPPTEKAMLGDEEGERVMHMALPIGGQTLMGSDISTKMGHTLTVGNNLYISLHADSIEEGEKLFHGLSEGGKVEMPFEKMFWGDYFSSFADKFGVKWMINYHESK